MESHDRMDVDASAGARVPFNQKWEIHKPLLKRLYLEENIKLPKIKGIMRDEHRFDAEVHQYKYRFDKWGWKKSMSSKTKARIVGKSQQRLNLGQMTAIAYQSRAVDSRKLIRYEKAERKKETCAVLFAPSTGGPRDVFTFNGIADNMTFMNWNLPYQALLRHFPQVMDHSSSPAMSVSTPSDVSIASPAADTALSPGLAQAVSLRSTRQNAALFIASDFEGLLRAFSVEDKKVFSTWMYEFWYFGFITAKHWGHGPKRWTVDDLWQGFQNATSPGLLNQSPPAHLSSLELHSASSERPSSIENSRPSPLCRWSIHIYGPEGLIEWLDEDEQTGSGDDLSQAWPEHWLTEPLEQKLHDSLESNSFSTVQASQLPVDLSLISQAARRSEDEMWREGLGFAIMGRNFDLLERMISTPTNENCKPLSKRDARSIHPAHLAAAYLDGSKTCCLIMKLLTSQAYLLGCDEFDRDSKGHTVFDALLLRILRSHSSTPLEVVDDALRGAQGYIGEEADICGRWDAESDSYRKLIGSGAVRVPLNWKHKFCHTSIQAICHCIGSLSLNSQRATSGLFLRRCSGCALTLKLQPLHALVLTSLLLLRNGMDGEDLFGMICCLFQVITSNAWGKSQIFSKCNVFAHPLQDVTSHDGCTHENLSPLELAVRLDDTAQQCGSPEARKGWAAFVLILQRTEEQHRWASEGQPPPGYEEEYQAILKTYENKKMSDDSSELEAYDDSSDDSSELEEYDDISDNKPELDEELLFQEIFRDGELIFSCCCVHIEEGLAKEVRSFGRNTCLGHVWAACQAELLTYRRREENHLWMSEHITIDAILECLRTGDPNIIPYVKNNMLEPYCACGFFGGYPGERERESVCTSYFSNLDDWSRTSFIQVFEE